MRRAIVALAGAALALGACQQKAAEPTAPVSDAEMQAGVESAKAAWISMDAARIDAIYAGDVNAWDLEKPDMIEGLAAMSEVNKGFAALKLNAVEFPVLKTRALGPDAFVMAGLAHFTSAEGEVKEIDIRFSEVLARQSDGSWKIVHEHIAFPPKAE